MSKRIDHLRAVYDEFNRNDFSGRLVQPPILIKRATKYHGKIHYRENRIGLPFDTGNVSIIVAEDLFPDWGLVYGTLLHEMIHQYQIQILGNNAPHDAVFNSIARHMERKYGFNVR